MSSFYKAAGVLIYTDSYFPSHVFHFASVLLFFCGKSGIGRGTENLKFWNTAHHIRWRETLEHVLALESRGRSRQIWRKSSAGRWSQRAYFFTLCHCLFNIMPSICVFATRDFESTSIWFAIVAAIAFSPPRRWLVSVLLAAGSHSLTESNGFVVCSKQRSRIVWTAITIFHDSNSVLYDGIYPTRW